MLNPDPHPASDSYPAGSPAQVMAFADAGPSRQLLMLALAMLVVAAATILGALGFEYIGHYEPCMLCLMQRTPYYTGIPVAVLAVAAVWFKAPRWITVVLFAVFGLLFVYDAGLAVYHSGVEWGFWEGPATCSQSPTGSSPAALLGQLGKVTPPSCSKAVWRFLGLSFAGWNVLISALLAVLGLYGARFALKRG